MGVFAGGVVVTVTAGLGRPTRWVGVAVTLAVGDTVTVGGALGVTGADVTGVAVTGMDVLGEAEGAGAELDADVVCAAWVPDRMLRATGQRDAGESAPGHQPHRY